MSVLQVYLNWVNSVLSDVSGTSTPCTGVTTVQEGKILCLLIDKLYPDANLISKLESSGNTTPQGYLRISLDHMRSHGIKFHFTPQDILDGDIKSILDVLWLIILNYSVHSITSSPYQRSVGIGKKLLLDWCQNELHVDFDPQNSLTYNLCTGDWFLKLLSKNSSKKLNEDRDREENLQIQLTAVEEKYGIKQNLINPSDITEGTVDEHSLMIYISLLRHKIGDSVDARTVNASSEPTSQSAERLKSEDLKYTDKTSDIPSIVLSEAKDNSKTPSPITVDDTVPTLNLGSSPYSASSHSSSTQSPRQGTDPETSDWMSQSSGSPLSSVPDKFKFNESKVPDLYPGSEFVIHDTISKHVEEHMNPQDDGMQQEDSISKHSSRIPIRVKSSDQSERSMSSPGRIDSEKDRDSSLTRKISIKVQRPRSPNSIMAEARAKQEQEKERKKREKEELARLNRDDKDETVMTGSASEVDISGPGPRVKYNFESDPVKSDEDDIVIDKVKSTTVSVNLPNITQMNGEIHDGVPVFVVPKQTHDMELLLEALKHARTEANVQDQLIQNAPSDQPDFQKVVDKNIEQLEAQLAAVKAQSRELFDERAKQQEMERGRPPARESPKSKRSEGHSPPRGILDVMANQNVHFEETSPKEQMFNEGRSSTPQSILRNRGRSPTDHAGLRLPSPHQLDKNADDADKRLIKFLTNEIENMKLKMAVMEQKNQRSQSPYNMVPKVTGGLPERDRSPAQISSRARARFADGDGNLGSYSPVRRARSSDLGDEMRSRSPRYDSPELRSRSPRLESPSYRIRSPRYDRSRSPGFESPGRSMSRSPARSPISAYRSRTPERVSSRERIRPISPSARVLSLQDLSTSVNDDIEGNLTFSPASGARPVNLGYSSPIRKVNDEIWGHGQTDDEYYADTAKYEGWKSLISRDAVSDEDNLELKQALASSLVELNILQAKLKNANADMKNKMGKTTEVLNDCRAQISKSQAENAELRGTIEREKQNREAQELRIKDMEENVRNSKTNQDDKTLELEEAVMTLKGIVNLDKNQMSQLEEENDKLRKKISEFQRENIKLKEDFNELKIYNDKAQQTIKDLKSCLEDARTERSQLVGEIKKLKDQGMNNTVSSIVNHYIEKGLYEDAEKDSPLKGRSRSQSPVRFSSQQRSVSPTFSRPVTPARCSSPVKISEPSYTPVSYTPVSRSQTPTQMSFNYEDISPGFNDDEHEIYPHRRTRSYVQKYGAQNEVPASQVDLNDPEIQEFLKPKTKLTYDLDLNENDNGPLAKRKLLYSPYMDKDYVPRSNQNDMNKDSNYKTDYFEKVPKKMEPPSQRKTPLEEEWESRKFIAALDHAVKQTPAQIAQERFLQDISSSGVEETARWRNPAKGILKNTKSAQNMSIKESISPNRRSAESRSFSPAVRSPLTFSQGKTRSFTPDSRLYGQGAPVRSYSSGMSRTYSPTSRSRSQSPKTMGQRSYSPGNRSYSPGYRAGSMKDSGYSTPTQQTRYHSGDNRDYGRPRTPVSSRSLADKKKSGLLSEEERRYADLLIDKYTRQQFLGIPLASS